MPKRTRTRSRRKNKRIKPWKPTLGRTLRTHTFMLKRKFYLENWQPSGVAISGFWKQYQMTIASLPDIASYASVFDQYKINGMLFEFVPRYGSFSGNDTTDTTLPGITNTPGTQVLVSYDNRTTQTISGTYGQAAANSFMEQGRVKHFYGHRTIKVYIKPTITQTIAGSATNNFRSSAWLPTTSTSHVHYGPSVFMFDAAFAGLFGNAFDVFCTYYVAFKNPK